MDIRNGETYYYVSKENFEIQKVTFTNSVKDNVIMQNNKVFKQRKSCENWRWKLVGKVDFPSMQDIKAGDRYFYINENKEITEEEWHYTVKDQFIKENLPCFRTEYECREWLMINDACWFCSYLEPNWKNHNDYKYYFAYDHLLDEVVCHKTRAIDVGAKYYFYSKAECERQIQKYGSKAIKKYVLGIK